VVPVPPIEPWETGRRSLGDAPGRPRLPLRGPRPNVSRGGTPRANGDVGEAQWIVPGVGLASGGALFWLLYFDLKDRLHPEPRRLLVASFLLGGLATAVAALGYRGVELLGVPPAPRPETGELLAYCLGVVGPIEEGAKLLVAWLVVFRWREFDERIDGIVYAGAVAIGFASFENLVYARWLPPGEQLARALVSPLTHSLFAALWGVAAARAYIPRRPAPVRGLLLAGGWAAAALAHGLYDAALLAAGAPWLGALLVLALWLPLIVLARRLVRARPSGVRGVRGA
jgi:RsiW-degrading membrane proteinase PrsW (M82 family)